MMIRSALVDFQSNFLDMTPGTVGERAKSCVAAGLIGVGRQGTAGARMTDRDATNLLLACVIEKRYGESVADNVRCVRELPVKDLVQLPWSFTDGLRSFGAKNAGDALDWFLDDVRSGRLATWAASEKWTASVSFVTTGAAVYISLHRPERRHALDTRSAIHSFTVPGFLDRPRPVERQLSIDGAVFLELAEALGPPES